MGKKKLKDIFKRTLAGVLSATMVLGMTASSTFAGTSTGTLPTEEATAKGDGETLTDATELTRASLGKSEINIITKDITNELGNAVPYKNGETYIAGYVQTSDDTDIAYVKGLRMNIKFSRKMPFKTAKGVDPKVDECFAFVQDELIDIFGFKEGSTDIKAPFYKDGIEEASASELQIEKDSTDGGYSYDYVTATNLYDISDEELGKAYNYDDPENPDRIMKPMAFIICLYNLQDDINIEYSFGEDSHHKHGYMPKGATSSVSTVVFEQDAIHVSPSLVRLKRYNVVFDTETTKLDTMTDDDVPDAITQKVIDAETPKIDSDNIPTFADDADYTIDGWYTDAALKNKFDTTQELTKALMTSDTNSDEENDTLTLYPKYTEKSAEYTINIHKTTLDNDAQSEAYEDEKGNEESLKTILATGKTGASVTIDPETYLPAGFKLDEDTTGDNLTKTISADGKTVFDIYYNRVQYTVQFNTTAKANGETVSNASAFTDKKLYYGTKLTGDLAPATPLLKDSGYAFKEWQTKNDDDTYTPWQPATDTVQGDMTLYADYAGITNISYTIKHYNKSTGKEIANVEDTLVKGQTFGATVKINPDDEKVTGYTYVDSDQENLDAVVLDSTSKTIILYYNGDAKDYKIEIYKENADANGYEKDADLTQTVSAHIGDEIELTDADIEKIKVEGFEFESGNSDNDLTGTVPVTGDLVLKLYYKHEPITITFDPEENKPEGATIDQKALDTTKLTQKIPYNATPEDPGKPSTPGYTFGGWSTDGETPFDFDKDKLTAGTELYPIWKAVEAEYIVERYEMDLEGNYKKAGSETKKGTVGTTVEAVIDDKTAEFTYDEDAEGSCVEGVIPATGTLTLKVYYKRNQYKVTFNLTDGKSIKDNDATLNPATIAEQTLYYGAKVTKPEDPTITTPENALFAGWFTDAAGTTPYDFETATIEGTTVLYAQLTTISLSFDDDALDAENGIYRRYLIGGADAVGGLEADKGLKGDQLNFTLTVGNKSLKAAEYATYTDEEKAMLDKVNINNEMIAGFEKIKDKYPDGADFRVADISKDADTYGIASARYAGIQKVTLDYEGIDSTNSATILIPGDTDASGSITVTDLSNMAMYLRGQDAGIFGDKLKSYADYLVDLDGNDLFIVADIAIAAAQVRGVAGFNNSFK